MSRGQEGQVFDTATQQSSTAANNAQQTYDKAQQGVQGYENQLAEFASQNPYKAGGEYQTSENKVLANTSDATAQAAGQTLQGAAVRTGGNPAAAIAATEAMNQQNTRDLSSAQGTADASRISNEAGYNDKVLQASSLPATLETSLSGQQLGAQDNSLGTAQKAGMMPSFGEDLFNGIEQAGASFAGAYGKSLGGCWIAARVFGGWDDRRTRLVRLWLFREFGKSWYGKLLLALYLLHGEWIADSLMPRYKPVQWLFEKVFTRALVSAEEWLSTRPGRLAWEHCMTLSDFEMSLFSAEHMADRSMLEVL